MQGHEQALADEEAQLFHVVGGPDHQLAGAVFVVVAEAEALDFAEEVLTQLEGDVFGEDLREVGVGEGEEAAGDGEEDNGRCHPQQRGQGVVQLQAHPGQVQPELARQGLLHRRGQIEDRFVGAVADDGVYDVLHQLGHGQLGGGGDEEGDNGRYRQFWIRLQIACGPA